MNTDTWEYYGPVGRAVRYSKAILNTKSLFPWPFVTLTAIELSATQQRFSALNVFSSHSEYYGEVSLCLRFRLPLCMKDGVLGNEYRWGVSIFFFDQNKEISSLSSSVQVRKCLLTL